MHTAFDTQQIKQQFRLLLYYAESGDHRTASSIFTNLTQKGQFHSMLMADWSNIVRIIGAASKSRDLKLFKEVLTKVVNKPHTWQPSDVIDIAIAAVKTNDYKFVKSVLQTLLQCQRVKDDLPKYYKLERADYRSNANIYSQVLAEVIGSASSVSSYDFKINVLGLFALQKCKWDANDWCTIATAAAKSGRVDFFNSVLKEIDSEIKKINSERQKSNSTIIEAYYKKEWYDNALWYVIATGAVESGNLQLFKEVRRTIREKNIPAWSRSQCWVTLLEKAARSGNLALFKALFKEVKGIMPDNNVNEDIWFYIPSYAAESGNLALFKEVKGSIPGGVNKTAWCNIPGYAAKSGNLELFEEVMKTIPLNVLKGWTKQEWLRILSYAAKSGNLQVVQYFFEYSLTMGNRTESRNLEQWPQFLKLWTDLAKNAAKSGNFSVFCYCIQLIPDDHFKIIKKRGERKARSRASGINETLDLVALEHFGCNGKLVIDDRREIHRILEISKDIYHGHINTKAGSYIPSDVLRTVIGYSAEPLVDPSLFEVYVNGTSLNELFIKGLKKYNGGTLFWRSEFSSKTYKEYEKHAQKGSCTHYSYSEITDNVRKAALQNKNEKSKLADCIREVCEEKEKGSFKRIFHLESKYKKNILGTVYYTYSDIKGQSWQSHQKR